MSETGPDERNPIVQPIDLGVTWAPNSALPLFFASDEDKAELWLHPEWDDADQSWIVLHWVGFSAAQLMPYNDEVRHLHPLAERGLMDILWAGEVTNSDWLEEVSAAVYLANRPSLRHFVVLLKDNMVEVVATGVTVERSVEAPAGGWMHNRVSMAESDSD